MTGGGYFNVLISNSASRAAQFSIFPYCTMPAAFALSVVMSAVSTAITMSMTRFSVLFVLSFMINQTHPALRAPHTLIFDCFD